MSGAEDDAPLIYGLEFQARALVGEKASSDVSRFMIATLTLKFPSNQIHIIELNDETGAIYSKVYSHACGEVWHLDWSPLSSEYILSTYQTLEQDDNLDTQVSLWKTSSSSSDEHQLEELVHVNSTKEQGTIRMGLFDPWNQNKMALVSENRVEVLDISSGKAVSVAALASSSKGLQSGVGMHLAKYNPEEGVQQVSVLQGTNIHGWDVRTNRTSYLINNSHSLLVRDIDYNRNRSSVIGSCGDDGCLKFWDLRMTSGSGDSGKALLTSSKPHQHWVTSCAINTTHDQLVVTSSTDSTVCLSAVSSVASDPVLSESADLGDSELKVYDHHEDSVCSVVWSNVDPFTFASLSIDGRLLTSTVPHHHKYKLLGI